jgi:hypothetical protein
MDTFKEVSIDILFFLESEFGLPDGILIDLFDESDWSFLIRIAAILEAAFAQSLTKASADIRLEGFFDALTFSEAPTGKIGMASRYKLIDQDDKHLIRWIMSARNRCVHGIKNLSISLEQFLQDNNEEKLNEFKYALQPVLRNIKIETTVSKEDISKAPRFYITIALVYFLIKLKISSEKTKKNMKNIDRVKVLQKLADQYKNI